MRLLIPLFTCPWPSLTSLTLRVTVAELPSLAPSARDSRVPRLRHLTYAIAGEDMDWAMFFSAFFSACPSLIRLDFAEVTYHTSLLVSLVASGCRADASMLPSCFNVFDGGFIAQMLAEELRTNTSAFNAFRSGRGLRVRVEAVFDCMWRYFLAEEYRRTFAAEIGYASYCLDKRTEQEWKCAWIAQPGWLF